MKCNWSVLVLGLAFSVLYFGCQPATEEKVASNPNSKSRPVSPQTVGFAQIQGYLDKYCVGCHGESGKDGIDMRTYESLMKGGKDGPIIVAGDSAASPMVQAMRGANGMKQMPPKQPPVPEQELQLIEAWIDVGAKS